MVMSLWRAFALPWASPATKLVPRIEFSALSERDLDDLNLPAEVRARLYRVRGRPFGDGRWQLKDWSPQDYLAFAGERSRPQQDLLAHVLLDSPRRIYDLGCGPGNSTALLAAAYPKAEITGIDNSRRCWQRRKRRCPIRFEHGRSWHLVAEHGAGPAVLQRHVAVGSRSSAGAAAVV